MLKKDDVRSFLIVVAAIMAAGYAMNAMRDIEIVKGAIAGYDA